MTYNALTFQEGVTPMKALNIRFNREQVLEELGKLQIKGVQSNKSEIARAALNIGLGMLKNAQLSMACDEFDRYVENEQKGE